jgi:putative hydrolase of the HAD superfamily
MRNGQGAAQFMVEYLNFPDEASAKALRDEYFQKYHATAKGLQIAEQEGRLPAPDPSKPHQNKSPRFQPEDLAEYWATKLDFSLLGGAKTKVAQDLQAVKHLNLVAFSNSPRKYAQRVLEELGMWETVFRAETLFAVDDVLPHCKPEKEAFEIIFRRVGVTSPEECVMVEDSMKNIKRAKELGMKTVLITGGSTKRAAGDSGVYDTPEQDDPAVDVAIEKIEDFRAALPGLWEDPASFSLPN